MIRKNEQVRRYGSLPYDGLFGDSNLISVLEEVIADPYIEYRPIDLVILTQETPPTVRKSLKILSSVGLLKKDSTDRRHPRYRVDTDSKRFLALNLLAYAVLDDKLGTDTVDKFIANYCDTILSEKYASKCHAVIESDKVLFNEYIKSIEVFTERVPTMLNKLEVEPYWMGRTTGSEICEQNSPSIASSAA